MRKYKLLGIIIILALVAFFTYSCGQVAELTTTTTSVTTTTVPGSPGYNVYSGADPSGQDFSFEYPQGWTVSQEVLTDDWNTGTWIMFKGSGDWQTGRPILSLWIVSAAGSLTNKTSYNSAAYSDRNVSVGDGTGGPELVSESSTTETVASLTAEGWAITYNTRLPLGRIYTIDNVEYHALMTGSLVAAERAWVVLEKGSYLYDFNFAAVGDSVASREAYVHAKETFQFN